MMLTLIVGQHQSRPPRAVPTQNVIEIDSRTRSQSLRSHSLSHWLLASVMSSARRTFESMSRAIENERSDAHIRPRQWIFLKSHLFHPSHHCNFLVLQISIKTVRPGVRLSTRLFVFRSFRPHQVSLTRRLCYRFISSKEQQNKRDLSLILVRLSLQGSLQVMISHQSFHRSRYVYSTQPLSLAHVRQRLFEANTQKARDPPRLKMMKALIAKISKTMT